MSFLDDFQPKNLSFYFSLLQAMIESIPVPAFCKDRQGVYRACNAEFDRLMGIDRDAILGRTVEDIAPPPYAELSAAADRELLRSGGRTQYESAVVDAEGRRKEVIACKAALHDDRGRITGLVGTAFDISDRKKMEAELSESETRFRTIFENAPLGMGRVSPEGRILQINPAFCRLTGYSEEELLGRRVADITHPDHHELTESVYRSGKTGDGRPVIFEKKYRRKDGSTLWGLVSLGWIPDEEGKIAYGIPLVQDISPRKEMEEALRSSEERFRSIFERAQVGMVLVDPFGRFLEVNPAFCEYLGYRSEDLLQLSVEDVTHPEERQTARAVFEEIRTGKRKNVSLQKRFRRRDGTNVWGQVTSAWIFDSAGQPLHAVVLVQDTTERFQAEKTLRESEERFRELADLLPQTVFETNPEGKLTFCSRFGFQSFGYEPGDLDGGVWLLHLIAPEERVRAQENIARILAGDPSKGNEYLMRRRDGSLFPALVYSSPVLREGRAAGLRGIVVDISDRKRIEEKLQENESRLHYLAYHDCLTHLPNRLLLHDRLRHAMAKSQRSGRPLALLFLDLDQFKKVNDSLGHETGDRLLCEVAARLRHSVREVDTLARLGGDEFVILLEQTESPEDVALVAQKILSSLAEPIQIGEHRLHITTSIGVSFFPSDGSDSEGVIKSAEVAMYRAKSEDRNRYRFYRPEMNARAYEKLLMEDSLRRALEREEFVVYFQPQVAIASGECVGFEALLRWRRNEADMVQPGDFIPLAEETGLIVPIGEWVLHQACRMARKLHEEGFGDLRMAVNISARQFRQADLAHVVSKVLRNTGIDPRLLELEITESMIMTDVEAAIYTMKEIRRRGVQLALDDFGSGYSSLAYLKRFPISRLKIDRSFIHDIGVEEKDSALAGSIINLARSLGMESVAEGVETEEQLKFLHSGGCQLGQGFYFARPMCAEEIPSFLKRRGRPKIR